MEKPAVSRANLTQNVNIAFLRKTDRDVFLCRAILTFWPFEPKITEFPGLIVGHAQVKFDDRSCIGLRDIVWRNKPTNRQTNVHVRTDERKRTPLIAPPTRPPSAWLKIDRIRIIMDVGWKNGDLPWQQVNRNRPTMRSRLSTQPATPHKGTYIRMMRKLTQR